MNIDKLKELINGLPKNVTIQIGTESIQIDYPNNGQLDDIEIKKQIYSSGQYSKIKEASFIDRSAMNSLIAINTKSILSSLVPKLEQKLNIKSIFELSVVQMLELTEQANKIYELIALWENAIDKANKAED